MLSSPGNLVGRSSSGSGTIADISSAYFGKDGAGTLTLVATASLALGHRQTDVNSGTVVFAYSPWLSLAGQSVNFGPGHGTLTLGAGSSVPFISLYQGTRSTAPTPREMPEPFFPTAGRITRRNAAAAGIIGVSQFSDLHPWSARLQDRRGIELRPAADRRGRTTTRSRSSPPSIETMWSRTATENVYLNHAVLAIR